eukprot:TRINITY_DN46489_c0_g1_i1.p1 TRINITY_DN46489_c0_g1~~TRINITY_DN46489_c0_g1_i1.p1  ORF type:complete len:255 (+),score=51.28 TRINITY_DN46489_c0_g1_i1:86-850(+)
MATGSLDSSSPGGAMDTASMSRSAAINGLGTGFGVGENVWTRELTEDNRLYYYNRATGATQWHLPNDLYQQQSLKGGPAGMHDPDRVHCRVTFPTHAKAMLRVDCVTEVVPPQRQETQRRPPAAEKSAADPRLAMAALEADPRNLDAAFDALPPDLVTLVRSPAFAEECAAAFAVAAADASEVPFEETSSAIFDIVGTLGNPALLPGPDRLRQLSATFDASGAGVVRAEQFCEYVCFVLAMQCLSHAAGDDSSA